MRTKMVLVLGLFAAVAAGSVTAVAQSDTCRGKVDINNVYPEGGHYKAQVQNTTGKTVHFELTFGGWPKSVVTKGRVTGKLMKNANDRPIIADSKDTSFNNGNVAFVYDRAGAAPTDKPFIRITGCTVE